MYPHMKGSPSQGGIPFVTIHATEDELRLILQTHKDTPKHTVYIMYIYIYREREKEI